MYLGTSSSDILLMTSNGVAIIGEPDLQASTTIQDLFKEKRCVAFFYKHENNQDGHWVLISYKKGKIDDDEYIIDDEKGSEWIEYFDPLALPIDKIHDVWGNPKEKKLSRILLNCGIPIQTSETPVETTDHETCGYHVAARYHFRSFDLYTYIQFISSQANISSDEFVTMLADGLMNQPFLNQTI